MSINKTGLVITFSKDCREQLAALGTIVFEDAELLKDFLILDTDVSMDVIRSIDGVISVENERTFSVDV